MAQILDKTSIKALWPRWTSFCVDETGVLTQDDVLDLVINEADGVLGQFVPGLTTATLTPDLKHHLLNLVRYFGFLNLHGDTEFDSQPAYVRLFNLTMKALDSYREGVFDSPVDPAIVDPSNRLDVVSVKTRMFDPANRESWFVDQDDKSPGSFVDSS